MTIDDDADTISSKKTMSIHSRAPPAAGDLLDASDIKHDTSSCFRDTQESYCVDATTIAANPTAKMAIATRLSQFVRLLIRGPTSSVDDPLNFSPRKKTAIIFIIAAASFTYVKCYLRLHPFLFNHPRIYKCSARAEWAGY